jgi:hypothetical protein
MTQRYLKYKPGSFVLLRQLDKDGKVTTVWGGQVLKLQEKEMSVLASEMVYQKDAWHCIGEFKTITAPPHRQPYKWDFPRLLVKFEANDVDLKAKSVIETAVEKYRKEQAEE